LSQPFSFAAGRFCPPRVLNKRLVSLCGKECSNSVWGSVPRIFGKRNFPSVDGVFLPPLRSCFSFSPLKKRFLSFPRPPAFFCVGVPPLFPCRRRYFLRKGPPGAAVFFFPPSHTPCSGRAAWPHPRRRSFFFLQSKMLPFVFWEPFLSVFPVWLVNNNRLFSRGFF